MQPVRVRLDDEGRLVIPASHRQALGLEPGDEVVISLDDHTLRVTGVRARIAEAQKLVRQFVQGDRSLVDDLLAQRRAEAERE
ncbi:AbrB/MazE/SpoVT family DNA-binding domain-containing protein [Azospirillum sp.]|uniref:AbrB/MazE/SpoVT family DNA-binding domain-containing protein n=1 Tax=Azospirillum sp. TaxID=34012 RepID=UPI002D34700A|nr:AbrB/MazE/SpoVT family DNA-binding domain-containing protein [Azospirillum sp.]HYD67060.1 AbrB/MazE/SpoVT family DNA-binding domain-containing protein [Azospirillum sp.]